MMYRNHDSTARYFTTESTEYTEEQKRRNAEFSPEVL
jgi:hypothetical protein